MSSLTPQQEAALAFIENAKQQIALAEKELSEALKLIERTAFTEAEKFSREQEDPEKILTQV